MGLNGEYDQSGLAKRVTLAFDQEPSLDDVETLWVAQIGDTVVLKGSVPNQDLLDQMVNIARDVYGTADVLVDQVEIEG
jgi:osmotically-inducible protein OsmY